MKPVFFDHRYSSPVVSRMARFLADIGLETAPAALSDPTFLDGLTISKGILLIDEAKLAWPGDLLHEAGHLAVTTPENRTLLRHNAGGDPAEEMMAIAWSYAAALAVPIEPALVFHSGGYAGGGKAILESFSQGRYFGVPMLEWLGLTADKKKAALLDVPPYPHMLKWLRE
jgi:hypothetical protein